MTGRLFLPALLGAAIGSALVLWARHVTPETPAVRNDTDSAEYEASYGSMSTTTVTAWATSYPGLSCVVTPAATLTVSP